MKRKILLVMLGVVSMCYSAFQLLSPSSEAEAGTCCLTSSDCGVKQRCINNASCNTVDNHKGGKCN
jgi:hypothetical protein